MMINLFKQIEAKPKFHERQSLRNKLNQRLLKIEDYQIEEFQRFIHRFRMNNGDFDTILMAKDDDCDSDDDEEEEEQQLDLGETLAP
jgi:hypothetical protein